MPDAINAYFKRFYPAKLDREEFEYVSMLGGMWGYRDRKVETIFPRIRCTDGFTMSVQGHRGAYSTPRDDFADNYTAVEVGFPSEREDLLRLYIEDTADPTNTVYGYVPIDVVLAIIEKHGGGFDEAPLENGQDES